MVRADGQLVYSQKRMDEHIIAITPPPYNPPIVDSWKFKRALIAAGHYNTVQANIDAIEDETQRFDFNLEWQYRNEVHRRSPFMDFLVEAYDLDEDNLDALFIDAGAR